MLYSVGLNMLYSVGYVIFSRDYHILLLFVLLVWNVVTTYSLMCCTKNIAEDGHGKIVRAFRHVESEMYHP